MVLRRLVKLQIATPIRQLIWPRKFVIHYERASLVSDTVIAIGKLVGAQALDLSTALRIRTRDSLMHFKAY